MKTRARRMLTVAVAGIMMVLMLVGCVSIDDVKGDWTLDKVGDSSLEDFASNLGMTKGQMATNITIKDDKSMTLTDAASSTDYDIDLRSNGFEVKKKGTDDIEFSVIFDKDAQTLSYETEFAGSKVKYIFVKGNTPIESLTPATDETSDGSGEVTDDSSNESTDEGTDESSDESSGEESEESSEEETE